MKRQRKATSLFLILTLTLSLVLPASAALLMGRTPNSQGCFSKNGPAGGIIQFTPQDFLAGTETLDSIRLTQLPDLGSGILTLGGQELYAGDTVAVTALGGLQFQSLRQPTVSAAAFSFTPYFSDGTSGEEVTVNLHLLTEENRAPIAENLELTTYKNVPVTGRFAATDPEGDLLTFRLVEKPARGAVSFTQEGGAEFVYTPYENKTGKDSFTYTAVDAVGNVSTPVTVKIRIEKPKTKVTYADLEGLPAQRTAIRLAEEEIFVGECMNGDYFFRPDAPVSRNEFVAMAMKIAGQDALTTISRTGFSDDASIPAWAKGYVASALKSGMVQGTFGANGEIVFQGADPITRGEACVLLNRILHVTDASIPTFYSDSDSVPAWAYQSAVNLETAGVLQTDSSGALSLSDPMTRADAADLLTGALDLLETREGGAWF